MARLIDADVLMEADLNFDTVDDCVMFRVAIDNAPTIEAKPVRHGRWIEEKTGSGLFDYRFRCSKCKGCTPDKAYTIAPDFCPNCGAKMDGDE